MNVLSAIKGVTSKQNIQAAKEVRVSNEVLQTLRQKLEACNNTVTFLHPDGSYFLTNSSLRCMYAGDVRWERNPGLPLLRLEGVNKFEKLFHDHVCKIQDPATKASLMHIVSNTREEKILYVNGSARAILWHTEPGKYDLEIANVTDGAPPVSLLAITEADPGRGNPQKIHWFEKKPDGRPGRIVAVLEMDTRRPAGALLCKTFCRPAMFRIKPDIVSADPLFFTLLAYKQSVYLDAGWRDQMGGHPEQEEEGNDDAPDTTLHGRRRMSGQDTASAPDYSQLSPLTWVEVERRRSAARESNGGGGGSGGESDRHHHQHVRLDVPQLQEPPPPLPAPTGAATGAPPQQ